MKPFVVFIPGIFGTTLLKCGEVLWPLNTVDKIKLVVNNVLEKPINTLFSSDKKAEPVNPTLKEMVLKLTDKNLTLGPITSNYNNIIALIKEITKDNFYIFTYDWRNSINTITDEFARMFDKLEVGTKDIVIIGHSAGGLIAYKYLGSGDKYDTEYSNFSKVKKCITIGAPLQGCVKALTAILGLMPQNLVTPAEIKEILSTEFFKSIYELCPHNIHNLFYHKDSRNPLTSKQIIEVLKKNGFPDSELKRFFDFKNELQGLNANEDVNYLFISGVYNKPMCSAFLVDVETGNMECVYDYGSGDGTVLKDESCICPEYSFRKMTVLGKHAYLTEIDDVLQIISEELQLEIVKNFILQSEIVGKGKQLEFHLFLIKGTSKYYITDFNAEHISFSRKTVTLDITKKISKKASKKDPPIFYFKTKEEYGFIRFKNLSFTYSDKDGNSIVEFLKYAKVELERQNEIFF